jgi:hypothetical protein
MEFDDVHGTEGETSTDGNVQKQHDDVGAGEPPLPREENEDFDSKYVTCPICNDQVSVPSDGAAADEALSRHIDQCQRRGGRRSRKRPLKEEGVDQTVPQKRTLAWQPRTSKPSTKKRKKVAKLTFVPRSTTPALDDMEEWQYEDRVDEWIESGVANMRKMDEHDQDEEPPGAEVYPGGLLIPAWMNNRLFTYQRTGLGWMWELFKQEAGGIVGDEMVSRRRNSEN